MALPIGEHVVNGVLSGVEARSNGWMRYSILQPGNTYPDKVDTKKPDIVAACQSLMGQQVSAQVKVEDSGNPNPNQPGTNFLNRYLNAIGPLSAGAFPQPQQAAQTVPVQQTAAAPAVTGTGNFTATVTGQPPQQPVNPFNPDARDLKIYRQVAWKSATELVAAGQLERDPVKMVQAAEIAMAYLVYGPARFGVTAFDTAAREAVQQAAAEVAQEQAPLPDPPANFNTELVPCAQCGAEPGFEHAPDCLPF